MSIGPGAAPFKRSDNKIGTKKKDSISSTVTRYSTNKCFFESEARNRTGSTNVPNAYKRKILVHVAVARPLALNILAKSPEPKSRAEPTALSLSFQEAGKERSRLRL